MVHGLLLGFAGSSATFAPLVADASLWFVKRRGTAVAICASGNYLAGAIWPPIVQHFVETAGWRQTYIGIGIFCAVTMPLLALAMRARPPALVAVAPKAGAGTPSLRPFGLSMTRRRRCSASPACLLRGDVDAEVPRFALRRPRLRRGAGEERSLCLLPHRQRLVRLICDRIGGLRTLLLGSVLQGTALLLFLPFDSLASLYVISALFGLFQGGIVPAYAIIVREYFPPAEAGARVGTVLMCTLFGMALGGWMSGKIFDLTGSYDAAFVNGLAWNALNISIALFLLARTSGWIGRRAVPSAT